ncbi:MAG: hypothetical protein ABSA72_12970, partial [Nitrososphaerales archaeon]
IKAYMAVLRKTNKQARLHNQELFDVIHSKLPDGYCKDYRQWHDRTYNERGNKFDRKPPSALTLIIWLEEEKDRRQAEADQKANEATRLALASAGLASQRKSFRVNVAQAGDEDEEIDLEEPERQVLAQGGSFRGNRGRGSNARKPDGVVTSQPQTGEPPKTRVDNRACGQCAERHKLEDCPKFKALSTATARREFCMDAERCFRCLIGGHRAADCRQLNKCTKCTKKHHEMLHGDTNKSAMTSHAWYQDSDLESWPEDDDYGQALVARGGGQAALRVVPIYVENPITGERAELNALLDEGAEESFLDEGIRRVLGLKGPVKQRRIYGFGGRENLVRMAQVKVTLRSLDKKVEQSAIFSCLPHPVGNLQAQDWSQLKRAWSHLRDLPFHMSKGAVHVLLGADLPGLAMSLREVRHPSGSLELPVARLTPLGWTAYGPTHPEEGEERERIGVPPCYDSLSRGVTATGGPEAKAFLIRGSKPPRAARQVDLEPQRLEGFARRQHKDVNDRELSEMVSRQWYVQETLLDNERVTSTGETRAVERLRNTKQFLPQPDGTVRIQLGTLWREGEPKLENNYHYARRRWESLEVSKLAKPEDMALYLQNIDMWLERKYVREVPAEEERPPLAYYLAHFPVKKESSSTTKIRPVMDGAARSGNPPKCLNDAIHPGPKMINNILDVFQEFRRFAVAVTADLEQMFLQILLAPEDRKFHRFILRRPGEEHLREYEFLVHSFGNASSPCVAIYAIKSYAAQKKDQYPLAWKIIEKASLVDDHLFSLETDTEAAEAIRQLRAIYKEINFHLAKFSSNHL